ncbi:MAG: hypothetical protein PVI43_00655 [Candidatus Bathyarchaeota archaeon]|jgi:hypothetical protein
MARGQDKPTVTGGGVDPYVQQSMAQNKQTANNRLLSAMQEASANKRAATAEQGANQRNTQQVQAEQEMNAANMAMQDRRAAEVEKGRREDMEYKRTIDQAQMALTKELEGNRLDWEKAKNSQDLERAKEAEDIEFDLRKLDTLFQARQTANNNNIMTTLLKTGLKREEAKEKFITAQQQQSIDAEQATVIYSKVKEAAYNGTKDILITTKRPDGVIDKSKEGAEKSVMGALQNQISLNRSKVNIEDLRSSRIGELETKIVSGQINFTDLRNARASIEGVQQNLDEKIEEASGIKKDYLTWQRNELSELLGNLNGLVHSKRKLLTDENLTIGSLASRAFGPIDGFSSSSLAKGMKDTGMDFEAMWEEMSKSINPLAPLEIPEGAFKSKRVLDFANSLNNIISGTQAANLEEGVQ